MEPLVNFIIRPPRAEYDPQSDLLDYEFMLKGKWFQRKDVEIKNSRGDVLQCSHYMPIVSPDGKPLPCVIYCHGNSGCRVDAIEAAMVLLPSNITVFTLDFSGSGISGGEHVTLGWNEKDDLRAVVNYLRADGNVSLIGLWGRSMGAVTSLMYGAEDPSIAGMVLDSPFSDLVDLMMELVDTYRFRLPKFTVKFAIQYMRKTIQKKAKFDIMDLNTIKAAKSCFVPALLGHAIDDDFIRPHHSDRILEAYTGDRNIIKFDGDHNSPRPQFYFDSINIFFRNVLQPPEDELGESFFDFTNDYFGEDVWQSVHELGYGNEPSSENKGMAQIPSVSQLFTVCIGIYEDLHLVISLVQNLLIFSLLVAEPSTSTVDAIKQVHPKRPMSRMEEDKYDDLSSSSSTMISFELSNGHLYEPRVPTTLNDDQYVEYQLDDLAGFSSIVDEEERMLMEAVIKSLKDREIRNPKVEQPLVSTVSTISIEPSDKHNMQHSSSTAPLPPSLDTSSGNTTNASSQINSSASSQCSTETDISHNTKATLTVIRNPAGHVMNGLLRRWNFNFFRKSQSLK